MHTRFPFASAALAGLVVAGSAFAQQNAAPQPAGPQQAEPAPPAAEQPGQQGVQPEQAQPKPQGEPAQPKPQGEQTQPKPQAPQAQTPIPIHTVIGYGVGQNCQYDAAYDGELTPAAGAQGQAQNAQAVEQRYSSRVKIRASVTCPNQPVQRSNETLTTGALPLSEIERTLALRGAVIAPGQAGRQCLYMPVVGLSPNGLTAAGVQYLCPVGGGAAVGGGPGAGQGGSVGGGAGHAQPGTQGPANAQPGTQAPANAAPTTGGETGGDD